MELKYYIHPESSSGFVDFQHPGELCEEISPVGPGGPNYSEFLKKCRDVG